MCTAIDLIHYSNHTLSWLRLLSLKSPARGHESVETSVRMGSDTRVHTGKNSPPSVFNTLQLQVNDTRAVYISRDAPLQHAARHSKTLLPRTYCDLVHHTVCMHAARC